MSRIVLTVIVALVLGFGGGWTAAGWQRDSIDLTIQRTAAATGKQLGDVSSKSARDLEDKLEALRNAPPREIRTELVKPVFTNRCLSDEFVSMYNDAAASTERALSGKPEN